MPGEPSARFIIGTGRCGSTILSKMLDVHPDVAVLSEFLVGLDAVRKFGERTVDGAELAEICDCGLRSTGEFKKIVGHLKTPEIGFDLEHPPPGVAPGNYRDGVYPELILLPLSSLFEDPTVAFDELVEYAGKQPTRPLSEQLVALFDWATKRAGKTIWVERSGGTLAQLPELLELFPDARFLHLHRDPFDVARSMKNHNHMRLFALSHYGLKTADGLSWADLDETDLHDEGPMSPRLRSLFEHDVPLDDLPARLERDGDPGLRLRETSRGRPVRGDLLRRPAVRSRARPRADRRVLRAAEARRLARRRDRAAHPGQGRPRDPEPRGGGA